MDPAWRLLTRSAVMRGVPALSILAALALTAQRAKGQQFVPVPMDEPPPPRPPSYTFTERPLTFDAVVGFGTPVGLAGIAVQYDVATAVAVGAGGGVGAAGPEFGALLRLRPFTWERQKRAMAIQIGSALAGARYQGIAWSGFGEAGPQPLQRYDLGVAYWAQFDIGFELKSKSGFHFVVAPGVALPLNADVGTCRSVSTGQRTPCDFNAVGEGEHPSVTFVLTLMLGYSI